LGKIRRRRAPGGTFLPPQGPGLCKFTIDFAYRAGV
jgi:hypothetical protein